MKKYLNLESLAILIVFALPSYLLRLSVFGIPTNVLECLMLVFLAVSFFSAANRKKAEAFMFENRMLLFFSGLMFLGLFLAAIGNPDLRGNLGIIKGWFILPFAFVFAARTVTGKDGYGKLLESLYWSAFFVAAISLGYLFSGRVTYDGRLESIFNSPNYLAMYLSPAIIIGFFMSRQIFAPENAQKIFFKKAIFLVSCLMIAAVIYRTFSYASWAALAVPLLAVVAWTKKDYSKKWLAGGIAVIAGVVMLQANADKFRSLVEFDRRSSLASRIMIWKAAFRILDDKWAFGIGPDSFQEQYLAYQKYFPPYLEWAVPHPHNLFLFIWLSAGVIGLVGFLGIVFFWAKKALNDLKTDKSVATFLAIMAYILLVGLLDTYMKNDLAVIFWLAVFSV
ncbi:MAG: O-antigen ligase family protein [Candidatus Moranbacteria bacterium]|nr:O-antigen ligase family protein [Candidatus Moranbacteria bacterium]